ncbi:XRE family transcriptional regulator [Sporosarcina globispora]|uniref:XRE family transcriptional regulator n=1 Tax=Sporosarcina globispora TaxID=1459 RepID=UPI0006A9E7B1|nr:XRE family transcriptional regulator [Sporosarcina globispora]
MEVLAKRLKWLRNKERYSQKEMADKIGMTPSGYQKIELSERDPKLDVLVKFCDIFNVSADFLLGREDDFDSLYSQRNAFHMLEMKLATSLVEKKTYEKKISDLRDDLITSAKKKGFADEETLSISQVLDECIAVHKTLSEEISRMNDRKLELLSEYIKEFLEIPDSNGVADRIISKYAPYTAYIQMTLFDENEIHLHGTEIGSLGHLGSFMSYKEAEDYQIDILKRLNGTIKQ